MPPSECKDCERDFPFGEGLIDGRCPYCNDEYQERYRETPPKATRPRRKGKEEK